MAINPSSNATIGTRFTAADANYPFGSSKNETVPGAGDGTPYFKGRADDIFGLQQALLSAASIVPSGSADTVVNSQYMQALVELISGRSLNYDDSGAANVYDLNAKADQYEPADYFDGLVVQFVPANTNTGASTVNLAGIGVESIKLPGGVADPTAGLIEAGRLVRLTFRTLPSTHFELDMSGVVLTQTITASGTYTPSPGVRCIKFTAVGGGGGAGSSQAVGPGLASNSGAGGAGGACIQTVTNISSSYTIVVGAGGAGGFNAGVPNGVAGTATTIVDDDTGTEVNISCGGGGGGAEGTGGTNVTVIGGAGGVASGGDVNFVGGSGGDGRVVSEAISQNTSGSSIFGGGLKSTSNATGVTAVTFGVGGGAAAAPPNTGARLVGGSGASGIVIVEEFF